MCFKKHLQKWIAENTFDFHFQQQLNLAILPFLYRNQLKSHVQISQSSLVTVGQMYHHYPLHPAANFNILSVSQSGSFKRREATMPPITPDTVVFWTVKSLSDETKILTVTPLSKSNIFLSYRQLSCQSRNWPLSNGSHLRFGRQPFTRMFTCEFIGKKKTCLFFFFSLNCNLSVVFHRGTSD